MFKRALALLAVLSLPAWAQYPGHVSTSKKPAPTMRSIAVVEWTGDIGKPSASRIIPISVFDGEMYQPGGLYLAKPQPLALEPGTEYVLQDAGVARGLFDVNSAQDVDGYWFGYGAWKPTAALPKKAKPKQGVRMPQVVTDSGNGRPHFKGRDASPGTDNSTPPDSSTPASKPPAREAKPETRGDPDRPTLRHRQDSSEASPSPDTPDAAPETATAGGDPDRPHMAHGQQTPVASAPPQLTGVPPGLQQMIAVSDAGDREVHPFVYLWSDPADAVKMQAEMELAASQAVAATEPHTKPAPKAHAVVRKGSKTAPPPPRLAFTNQHFKAYELTYSGGATLVFSAETTDPAGQVKYVTLIAQPDFNGVPKVLFKSITDDSHLDQIPKMRLVDAVDARANNRGDLVFELRTRHEREFVIYRISAGLAEQVFTTGSLPNATS